MEESYEEKFLNLDKKVTDARLPRFNTYLDITALAKDLIEVKPDTADLFREGKIDSTNMAIIALVSESLGKMAGINLDPERFSSYIHLVMSLMLKGYTNPEGIEAVIDKHRDKLGIISKEDIAEAKAKHTSTQQVIDNLKRSMPNGSTAFILGPDGQLEKISKDKPSEN